MAVRSHQLNLRLDDDEMQTLEMIGRWRGLDHQAVLRMLIKQESRRVYAEQGQQETMQPGKVRRKR